MKIKLIAAVSENGVIGKDNKLPWHLPADLKYFKEKTMGNYILMGRKTFESIGGGRPLPGRITIIITKQEDYIVKHNPDRCIIINSTKNFINTILEINKDNKDLFICGGAEIYKEFIDIADELLLTIVHDKFEGDTYLPVIEYGKYILNSNIKHKKDDHNKYDYTFQHAIKNTNQEYSTVI